MEMIKALVMTAEDDDTSVPVLPSNFFSLMFLIPVTGQCLGQRTPRRFVQQVQKCFVQLLLLHSKGISIIQASQFGLNALCI